MKRFKVLSLMSVFLLLFAGVALAQNAVSVYVEVGYPCHDGQEECNTGEAVSRDIGGDDVNILITLLDATGNPATAGPNGELLTTLTATVSTTLGDTIPGGEFAADAEGVAFGADATARAIVDYTDAVPGIDQVVLSESVSGVFQCNDQPHGFGTGGQRADIAKKPRLVGSTRGLCVNDFRPHGFCEFHPSPKGGHGVRTPQVHVRRKGDGL